MARTPLRERKIRQLRCSCGRSRQQAFGRVNGLGTRNRIDRISGEKVLTKKIVNDSLLFIMVDLHVIDDPASASVALDPVRSRLLSELRTPMSAARLAGRLGLPRQKVNYHLRTLEKHGLVRVDSKKRWGG